MIIEQLRNLSILAVLVIIGMGVNMVYKAHEPTFTEKFLEYSPQEMRELIISLNGFEEYEKALVLADKYVELYPDDTEGYVHRGYAYLRLGNCEYAFANLYHASINGGGRVADELFASMANSETCKEFADSINNS